VKIRKADSAEPFLGVKKWSAAPAEHFLGEKSVRQTLPSISWEKKVFGRPCRAFPQLQKAKKIRKNKEQDNETEI
jgi:hypothetical protein